MLGDQIGKASGLEMGAEVRYHDAWVPTLEGEGIELSTVDLTDGELSGCDLAIITTRHGNVDYGRVVERAPLVLDTRNALKGMRSPKIRRL